MPLRLWSLAHRVPCRRGHVGALLGAWEQAVVEQRSLICTRAAAVQGQAKKETAKKQQDRVGERDRGRRRKCVGHTNTGFLALSLPLPHRNRPCLPAGGRGAAERGGQRCVPVQDAPPTTPHVAAADGWDGVGQALGPVLGRRGGQSGAWRVAQDRTMVSWAQMHGYSQSIAWRDERSTAQQRAHERRGWAVSGRL